MQIYSNFAQTYLTSNIDTADTTISVATTDGGLFTAPTLAEFELLTITDGTYWEVVKMIDRVGDIMEVERGHEGLIRSWLAGAIVKASITEDTLDRFLQKEQVGSVLTVFAYQNFK